MPRHRFNAVSNNWSHGTATVAAVGHSGARQAHARLACCLRVLRCDRFGHTISKSLIRDALTACQGNKLQAEAALKELVPEQYADAVAIAAAVEEGKSQSSRRRLADELRASRARGVASKPDAGGAGKAGGVAGHELVATLFVAPAVTPVEEVEAKGGSKGGVRTGTSPWFFDEAAERSAQAALRRLCSCGAYASASGHAFKCGGTWACCVLPQSGALGAPTLCSDAAAAHDQLRQGSGQLHAQMAACYHQAATRFKGAGRVVAGMHAAAGNVYREVSAREQAWLQLRQRRWRPYPSHHGVCV